MAAIWSELRRDRWSWSERALVELRQEVEGLDGDVEVARLAHVMVLGDTQVGKTTLLIRLLGVRDPDRIGDAEEVLRFGRDKAHSATAAPIRYRWSPDERLWLLVRGGSDRPELLTREELTGTLAELRGPDGDTLRWRADQRPLEIGLPTRLAPAAERRELRVLDVPGLFAKGAEQPAVEALVSRLAPVMSLVVFVQQADKMADSFNDKVIRDHPHLSAWTGSLDRYRVVLTRAFTNGNVQKLLDPRDPDPERVAARVREEMAGALAGSIAGGIDPQRLAQVVYPVELGESWRDLGDTDPELASLVGPANELLLDRLRRSIELRSGEDAYHLAAPEMALRIEQLVDRRAMEREEERAALEGRMRQAEEELAKAETALGSWRRRRDEAARRATVLRLAVDDLRARTPPYQRPEPPELDDGNAVRARQEDERAALHEAARALWRSWRSTAGQAVTPCPFPSTMPLDEARLRDRYDTKVDCCQTCTGHGMIQMVTGRKPPDHCYGRMGRAGEDVSRWVPGQLATAAQPAVAEAEAAAARAGEPYAAALSERDRCQREVDRLRPRLAQMTRDHAEASRREERDRASAREVTRKLDQANKEYVEELRGRMMLAAPADRPWYVVAILRTLLDLERMMGAA